MNTLPKYESLADEALWKHFINGSIEALETVYRKYFKDIYQYGMTIFPDNDLVRDAIQEVFISLVQQRNNLTATKNIKHYLLKALRNKIYTELTNQKRSEKISNEFKGQMVSFLPSSEHLAIEKETEKLNKEELVSVINQLPERQREIILLIFFEDRSYEEVSNIMSMNVNSAYKLTWKAINTIKKNLRLRNQRL